MRRNARSVRYRYDYYDARNNRYHRARRYRRGNAYRYRGNYVSLGFQLVRYWDPASADYYDVYYDPNTGYYYTVDPYTGYYYRALWY